MEHQAFTLGGNDATALTELLSVLGVAVLLSAPLMRFARGDVRATFTKTPTDLRIGPKEFRSGRDV
jgi:hypothetical protein